MREKASVGSMRTGGTEERGADGAMFWRVKVWACKSASTFSGAGVVAAVFAVFANANQSACQ